MAGEKITPKLTLYSKTDLESLGNRKRAFTLLAFYLDTKQNAIYPHYIDKIINERDINILNESWKDIDYSKYGEKLGNQIIIDSPRKSITLDRKLDFFKNSTITELNTVLYNKCKDWNYLDYEKRENTIQETLLTFFNESINETI